MSAVVFSRPSREEARAISWTYPRECDGVQMTRIGLAYCDSCLDEIADSESGFMGLAFHVKPLLPNAVRRCVLCNAMRRRR
jgi:hypothetical protein